MRRTSNIPALGGIPPSVRSGSRLTGSIRMGRVPEVSSPVASFTPNTVKADHRLQDAYQALKLGLAAQRDKLLEVLSALQGEVSDKGDDPSTQEEIAWLMDALKKLQEKLP